MRFHMLTALIVLACLCGCVTTDLAPVLKPVARDLPLAQINHRTDVGERVEIAIWRDGTVIRRYDKDRYVVAHAMPETLAQLNDRINELDLTNLPQASIPNGPVTTMFVSGRRQATRPVAFFSAHRALTSSHELEPDSQSANEPFHLLWRAVRENLEIASRHTINPEFVPADFNTRQLWKTDGSGEAVAVLEIYGNTIDTSPVFISVDHTGMFPDK